MSELSSPTLETPAPTPEVPVDAIDQAPEIEPKEVVANAEGRVGNIIETVVMETPGFTEPAPDQFSQVDDPKTPARSGGRRRAENGGVSVAELKAREDELASQQATSANIPTHPQETDADALGASIKDQLDALKQTTEEFGRENNISPEAPTDPDTLGESVKEQLQAFKASTEQFARDNNIAPESAAAETASTDTETAIEDTVETQTEAPTTEKESVETRNEDTRLSVAEIAHRLETEDKNKLAQEIVQKLGHTTARVVSRDARQADSTMAIINQVAEHNQNEPQRPGKNIGLLASIKERAKGAYARFQQRLAELTLGRNNIADISEEDSEEDSPPTQEEKDDEELEAQEKAFYANKIDSSLDEAYRMNEQFDEDLKKWEEKEKSKANMEEDETLTPYEQYIQARRHEAMLKARAKNVARIRRQEAFQAKKEQWSDATREKWDNAKDKISTSRIGRICKGVAYAARFTASVGRGMFRGAKAGARMARSKR